MERTGRDAPARLARLLDGPFLHFIRGLVREGQQENAGRIGSVLDQITHTGREHVCFACSGRSQHQDRAFRPDRFQLFRI